MTTFFYILLSTLLCAATLGGMYLFHKRGRLLSFYKKGIALFLGALLFWLQLYREAAVYNVRGVDMYSPFGDHMLQTVTALLLIWFTYAAVLIVIMSAFFDYKTLHNLARFFAPVVLLADLVLLPTFLTGWAGEQALAGFQLHGASLLVMIGFSLALAAGCWLHDCTLPTRNELGHLFLAMPFAALAIMPAYIPQALLGFLDSTILLYDFTEHHRLMLYLAIVIPVAIFFGIKDKDEETKRFLMIYLSVGLLYIFIARWNLTELMTDPVSWPLHLCHTAMFLIPLCLIFRMRRLFNFCFFINVLGALFAMIIPGELDNVNALATERVSFWINHWAAFFMPVLLVSLKIFKRPKLREWAWSLVSFCVYFFSILFINAWFDNFGNPDFFFLNSDFVVSNIGQWAEDTRKIIFSFQYKGLTFTFYPLYQALFFVIFVGMTVGVWFIYALLFSMWDTAEERRERAKSFKMMKKDLTEFLNGRSIDEPITGDASPSLVLRNFSKKYGNNNFYSVKDVSFEVKGGEIFGFLGPNGAGKSTIIKSIVGIQPLTSGDIEVCGYHVDKQAVQAKLQIGFVPDHYALYETLTGREYINYLADLYRVTKEYRDAVIQKYTERFQLVDSFDNQMKTYSHGMKQKITIMAALVHNPKVWILDEPLTGLDPNSIHEVKECMREHAAAGNIVFFSSHIIDVVEKICDRIAIIKKGKLRACTTLAELEEQGIELEKFYLSTIKSRSVVEEPDEAFHVSDAGGHIK